MAKNLRTLAESDLSQTLEADFAMPVVLISPEGDRIPASGRVLYTRKETQAEGEPIVVNAPLVTLRASSLPVVPKTGENWYVEIPESVLENAPMKGYLIDFNAAVEKSNSLGFVNLPLMAITAEPALPIDPDPDDDDDDDDP